MSSVASIASVTSPSRTAPAHFISNLESYVSHLQALKPGNKVLAAKNISASKAAPAAASGNLPLGLLLSVTQPSSGNALAVSDYHQLRLALDSGNLTAAQQAYLRLQSDLVFNQPAQTAASNNTQASGGNNLDAIA